MGHHGRVDLTDGGQGWKNGTSRTGGRGGKVGGPHIGNGPNTVSGCTVSNTELSEFFGAH